MDDKNPHAGSTLESLLRQDGIYEDVKNYAVRSIPPHTQTPGSHGGARPLQDDHGEGKADKSLQLDRLLDPLNEGVTLQSLKRAAAAVEMRLELELRQA